jgi:hypothetical protein
MFEGETPAQLRARWDAGYADMELPPDVEPYGEQRVAYLKYINAMRARVGNPPFENDEIGNPELTERRRLATERYQARQATIQAERREARGLGIS